MNHTIFITPIAHLLLTTPQYILIYLTFLTIIALRGQPHILASRRSYRHSTIQSASILSRPPHLHLPRLCFHPSQYYPTALLITIFPHPHPTNALHNFLSLLPKSHYTSLLHCHSINHTCHPQIG
jgi:hypothetical protein